MNPGEWLSAVLSVEGRDKIFRIARLWRDGEFQCFQVLHKESGALWEFKCRTEREHA